jgi:hypothetical protein
VTGAERDTHNQLALSDTPFTFARSSMLYCILSDHELTCRDAGGPGGSIIPWGMG